MCKIMVCFSFVSSFHGVSSINKMDISISEAWTVY